MWSIFILKKKNKEFHRKKGLHDWLSHLCRFFPVSYIMLDTVQKGKCQTHWGSVWHVGGFTQAQKSNTGIGANTLGNSKMDFKSELEFSEVLFHLNPTNVFIAFLSQNPEVEKHSRHYKISLRPLQSPLL